MCVYFVYYLCVMYFYGDFVDVEVSGDLFVEVVMYYVIDYFLFVGIEGVLM